MSVRGRLSDGAQLAALVAVCLVLMAGPLAAQDALEQTAQAGAFVDSGAEDVDEEALAAAVDEVRADGVRLYVGVLAEDPAEGVESAADTVLDHAGEGTALLLSPGEVGASSDEYGTATIDEGLDAAAEDFAEAGDIAEGVRTFGGVLATADSGSEGALGGQTGNDGNSGGLLGGLSLPVILIGGLVVLVLLAMMFGGGRRRRRRSGYAAGGYGHGGYGRRRHRRRRGGVGSFAAGAATATAARRMRGNRSTQTPRQSRPSSRSSGRSTGRSRSRSSSSRSRSRSSRRR